MPEDIYLSVVIPAFNEQRNILTALNKISSYVTLKKRTWEILVVNDGSKDGTSDVCRKYIQANPDKNIQVIDFPSNRGKGYAVKQGVLSSRGRYVLITDVDMSSPIKEADKLINALVSGADVAIGSRALRKTGCDVRQSFKRYVSGRIFNLITRALILPGIYDSQCGFKCFSHGASLRLFSFQKLDGFSFDVEILYLARKFKYKIAEVPVMWSQGEGTRVSFFRDSIRMVKDLFVIKKNHR